MNKTDWLCLGLAIFGIVYVAFFVIGVDKLQQDAGWLVILATLISVAYEYIIED